MTSAFRTATRLLTPLAMAALLAGCSSLVKSPPAFCPRLGLLDAAGDLTRFQGAGRDITDITLSGKIDAVPAQCHSGGEAAVATDLTVRASFLRGTAAKGRTDSATYLVTVLRGDDIIEQRNFVQAITFPPGADRVAVESAPIQLSIPVPGSGEANYRVFVGFRLSADELAYNRTHPSP